MPHPDLKNSFGVFLYGGETEVRKSGIHKSGFSLEDWTLAITEVPSQSVSKRFQIKKMFAKQCFLTVNYQDQQILSEWFVWRSVCDQ